MNPDRAFPHEENANVIFRPLTFRNLEIKNLEHFRYF
jgi:hypothetical protein